MLQGVESYWLQAFPLPGTVINKVVIIARDFMWGSKHAHVAWKEVSLPKEEGGLGIRDLKTWNTVLHAKILWNIHAKDTMWIRYIHTKFIRNGTIWDWRARAKTDSPLIKKILKIRDVMLSICLREEVIALWTTWNVGKGTRDAYEWFRPKGEWRFWARFVWKFFIPSELSFTTWQAIRNRLPTRNRLHYLDIDRVCPLCSAHYESSEHLFFTCAETKRVWEEIKKWLGLRRSMTSMKSAIKWMARENRGSTVVQKAKRIALTTLVNFTWKAKNALIF